MEPYVLFVNKYLSLEIILEYLQRTDIYLFTSKDPQQAVSGTLAYAMPRAVQLFPLPSLIPWNFWMAQESTSIFQIRNNWPTPLY